MSSYKLPFGLVLQETAILLLLLVYRLLLLRYVLIVCHKSIILITFAGRPPTIALAGTSLVTTAPATTMALSPMVTPCRVVTFAPSHTFLPMCIGLADCHATVHLQRTGDTMAPSFLRSAKALSTSLRSAFKDLATSPADTGLPAARMAFNTCSFIRI